MSTSGICYNTQQTFDFGNASIPVTVTKSSRRRDRRKRNRRQKALSVSSANEENKRSSSGHQDNVRKNDLYDHGHDRGHRHGYAYVYGHRSRAESFGAQSTISRGTYDLSSRRGSYVDHNRRNSHNDYSQTDRRNNQDMLWDRLSKQIWRYYENHCQTAELWNKKTQLKDALDKIMTTHFRDYNVKLYMVGSSYNGLAGDQSDLDICLVMNKPDKPVKVVKEEAVGQLVDVSDPNIPKEETKEENKEMAAIESNSGSSNASADASPSTASTASTVTEAKDSDDKLNTSIDSIGTISSTNGKNDPSVPMLEEIVKVLEGYNFVEHLQIIMAKVPIVKFNDRISGIEVTINVNKLVSIRNTCLVRDYTYMDWRLQPLVIVVKAWAKDHGIKDAYNKSISSYSMALMVIHYLQYGCEPPVLPCLQRIDPDRYAPNVEIRKIWSKKRWSRRWKSRNNSSLKELFIGFLEYYSYGFCYDTDAISVRLGHVISKSKVAPHSMPLLCIEEPFTRTNTAHSVYDRVTFERILQVFRVSHYTLRRYPYLTSIMIGSNDPIGRTDAKVNPRI